MTAAIILLIGVNVAMFVLSIAFFYYGWKQRRSSNKIFEDAIALQDDTHKEMEAVLLKHQEIGALLAECKEVADDIKSGRIKYVQ